MGTDCDCYNDHNNHINPNINININMNIITCEYDNYDEDNNNHVGRYDVGLVKGDDLVTNDCEENNDATSSVPCVVSSSGATSIADDCGPVCANDHYMIRCYNKSPTISSTSSLTSFTIPLNLPSLETSSSRYRDICVGCHFHNGDDTDLDPDLVPVHFSPITSTQLSLVPSSLEPTSLSSNLFHLSSDCGFVSLRYVDVAVVASLTTTAFLSSFLPSTTFSFLPVLDSSFVSYWLSSKAHVLDTIGSSFNPSDVPVSVNLCLVWSLGSSPLLVCFASSTISLYPLLFKIYCDYNPISLVLMIILMIMGLCWFPGLTHFPVMHWISIQDSIQVTSSIYLISLSRIVELPRESSKMYLQIL